MADSLGAHLGKNVVDFPRVGQVDLDERAGQRLCRARPVHIDNFVAGLGQRPDGPAPGPACATGDDYTHGNSFHEFLTKKRTRIVRMGRIYTDSDTGVERE